MKLTESQARKAIRKWLFEYTTDSGVSHRASTDDKIAGKLGDDRENQPSSTIPQEIPIMPMSQMSTQLSHEMPAVEDADFIPGTVEELGKSADVVAQQIPHSEIEWFYEKIKEVAEEAIEKGNKVNVLDEYEPDQKESNPTIRPAQKASKESTNESWNRWSSMLSKTLREAKRGPKNDPLNLRRRKFTKRDMMPTYQDEEEWLSSPIGDFDGYRDDDSKDRSPYDYDMGGEVVGGEYLPTQEELEEMGVELDRGIDELPGYDSRRHRTNQEVISQGDGEEAKLRELVDLKIFPNIFSEKVLERAVPFSFHLNVSLSFGTLHQI